MANTEKRTNISDAITHVITPKFTTAPTEVSIGAATARSAQLAVGQYIVSADVDCYILQGGSAVDATTSSHRLPADTIRFLDVTGDSDDYVAVIRASTNGTLQLTVQ